MASDIPINQDDNLEKLKSQLNTPEAPIVGDPADVITDKDKPSYSSRKKSSLLSKLDQPELTTAQISSEVKKAFAYKPTEDTTHIPSIADRKRAVFSGISADITTDKNLLRTWIPKVRNMLPKQYTDVPEVGIIGADPSTKIIVDALTNQRKLSADQFIRNKSSELIRDKYRTIQHQENITVLSQILALTARNHRFFETTFRKYLTTSIELKFKHIFVAQDTLKYTKLMLETLTAKLESVKHNTSLSEVAKISAFGEFKRTLRLKANAALADAMLNPLKEPMGKFIEKTMNDLRVKVRDKYAHATGDSPIEFNAEQTGTSKAGNLIRKTKQKFGGSTNSYVTPEGVKVIDSANQNKFQKAVSDIISIARPDADNSSIMKTLSKKATDKATFDNLTRRSIVDIIPTFLAKIHQQSVITAKALNVFVKRQLTGDERQAFDKDIDVEELRFDRNTEQFVTQSEFDKTVKENLFGGIKKRTALLKPTIETLRAGYSKHGGDDETFKAALPDLVKFVTNIGKHAQVVKLDHIKKYLDGAELSEFEQGYLDSVLVDVPETSKKRLLSILGTAFFKDDTRTELDRESTYDIGRAFRDLVKAKEDDTARLSKLGSHGDLRGLKDLVDPKTGKLNQQMLRQIQGNVDHESLLKKSSAQPDIYDILKNTAGEAYNDVKLKKFKRPLSRPEIDDISNEDDIPNRDEPQVSGPGLYYQGVKRELHVPLDNIKKGAKKLLSKFQEQFDKHKVKLPDAEKIQEKVDELIALGEKALYGTQPARDQFHKQVNSWIESVSDMQLSSLDPVKAESLLNLVKDTGRQLKATNRESVKKQFIKYKELAKNKAQSFSDKHGLESKIDELIALGTQAVSSGSTKIQDFRDQVSKFIDSVSDKQLDELKEEKVEQLLALVNKTNISKFSVDKTRIKDTFNEIVEAVKASGDKALKSQHTTKLLDSVSSAKDTLVDKTEALKTLITDRIIELKSQKAPQAAADIQSSGSPDALTNIHQLLIKHFATVSDFQNTSIQLGNQILLQLSMSGAGGQVDESKKKSLFAKIIRTPFSMAGKGAKLYMKGMGKFYSGLFGLGKKVVGGVAGAVPGILSGGFNLGKKAVGLGGDILSTLLGFYGKVLGGVAKGGWKLAKGTFNLGKKLLSVKNRFVDVFRKDEVDRGTPLIKGLAIQSGQYVYADGSPIKDSYSISGPVFDTKTNQLVISAEDIKHGLVDFKNDPLIGTGRKLFRKAFGAYAAVLKGSFKLTKGIVGLGADIIGGIFSAIPGLKNLFRRGKKKKGDPTLDNESMQELVTKHLINIISLLKPISAHYGQQIREGSYADYKRDREAEQGKKSRRARDVINRDRGASAAAKAAGGTGILGAVASLFGGGGEGGSALGTIAQLGVGGYALKKVKDIGGKIFGKKAAVDAAGDVAKTAAKAGMLKSLFSKLGGKKASKVADVVGAASKPIKVSLAKRIINKGGKAFGGTKGSLALAALGATGSHYANNFGDEADNLIKGADGASDAAKAGDGVKAADGKSSLGVAMAKELGITLAVDKGLDFYKKIMAKRAAKGVAEVGAKQVAKSGLLRGAMSGLARFGIGQGLRSAAVATASAVAGTVSAPVLAAGLAVAGLTAGGIYLWSHRKGAKRREAITQFRNTAYHIPEDNLKVVVKLENELAKTLSDKKKSELINSNIREYIKDFGLDPDDPRQFTFFKHWYITLFFPVFKASYDVITNEFKIKFEDQEDLTDEQLNTYKSSLEQTPVFQECKQAKLALSEDGFKAWEKENYFSDDAIDTNEAQKRIDDRLDKAAELISKQTGKKGAESLKFDQMQDKAAAKYDDIFDGVGMPSVWPSDNVLRSPEEIAKARISLPSASTPEKSLEEYKKTFANTQLSENDRKSKGKIWAKVERPIVEQLIRLGWTKAQAIGIAANIHAESGGDHTIQGDKTKNGEFLAYGLAQWHPPRQALFKKKFGKDIRQSTLAEQVAFIDYELNSGDTLERKAGRELRKASTPEEAASTFTRYYERPSDKEGEPPKRAALAAKMKKNYADLDEKKLKETEISEPESIKTEDVAADKINKKDEQTEKKEKVAKQIAASSDDDLMGIGMPSVFADDNLPDKFKPSTKAAEAAINQPGEKKGWFAKAKEKAGSIVDATLEGFSGGFAGGTTDIETSGELGDAVAKYESGAKGVGSISSGKGDPGGASYGKYQLASKTGTLQRYLKSSGYAEAFSGMTPGQSDFNAKWAELAKSDSNFGKTQHEFIKNTHFDPAIKEASKLGFDASNRGIQEAIWSGSIQHGGIKRILAKTAALPGFKEMTPQQQIAAFYQARGDYAASAMRANGASESTIQNASYGRYSREIKDALALSGSSVAQDNVKAVAGQPGPVAEQTQTASSQVMQDIQDKNVAAGLPNTGPPMIPTEKPSGVAAAEKAISTPVNNGPSAPVPGSGSASASSAPPPAVSNIPAPAAGGNVPSPAAPATGGNVPTAPTANTYVDNFVSTKSNVPAARPMSAVENLTRNTDVAKASAITPMATPEVKVIDPEGKNQTTLLTEQNQLLSQMVSLLGGQKSSAPGKPAESVASTAKSDDVVKKLDEVIKAISASNQQLTASLTKPDAGSAQGATQTRRVAPTDSAGINIQRTTVS